MTLLIRHMILIHIQDLQGMRLANTLPKEIIKMDASKKKGTPTSLVAAHPKSVKIHSKRQNRTTKNHLNLSNSIEMNQKSIKIHLLLWLWYALMVGWAHLHSPWPPRPASTPARRRNSWVKSWQRSDMEIPQENWCGSIDTNTHTYICIIYIICTNHRYNEIINTIDIIAFNSNVNIYYFVLYITILFIHFRRYIIHTTASI